MDASKPKPPAEEPSTVVTAASPPTIVYRRLTLQVIQGPDEGRTVSWHKGRVMKVGRSPESGFRLCDPEMSRAHFSIQCDPDGVVLQDSGSQNGTFLQGVAVQKAPLEAACEIRAGNTVLSFTIGDEEIDLATPPEASVPGLVGQSSALQRVRRIIEAYAPLDEHVLISGETGTGKELVAQALHALSGRKGPLVRFSGATASPSTFESALFGHVRGAYTGAGADRLGAFRAADHGTLFLDEVQCVPLDLQPRLLHAVEHREIQPLGSDAWHEVDVRFIAATNQDLSLLVDRQAFQLDLFHRICGLPLTVPPLREHPEDIPALFAHFASDAGKPHLQLARDALAILQAHAWPGNVRELKHVVSRCMATGKSTVLHAAAVKRALEMAPSTRESSRPRSEPCGDTLKDVEVAHIQRVLQSTGGNKREAAKRLGISETALHAKLNRYGLRD